MKTGGFGKNDGLETLKLDNAMTTMFLQTGKESLLGRMASPLASTQPEIPNMKKLNSTHNSSNMGMGSTMAATQMFGQTRNVGGSCSSPFRQTIARGMVTGVGFLNKP